MTAPLLAVEDLDVVFRSRRSLLGGRRSVHAVRGVTFDIARGETFGLVGESGSGKSTTARAVLRLVDATGSVRLEGQSILDVPPRAMRPLRTRMQMVFQDPYSSIDPSQLVADIVAEPLDTHLQLSRAEREARVAALLTDVGLEAHHLRRYPHEFSGGQRQRIAIARAIALNPSLVICDEAVSALDVSTQNQVINLLEDLRARHDMAYLFITHNLSVVRHIAHRVGVMYLGRLVETAPTARLFAAPSHPYTRALIAAMPVARAGGRSRTEHDELRGEIPDPSNPPSGCAFHPRCPSVMDVCRTVDPPLGPAPDGGMVACHLYDNTASPAVPVSLRPRPADAANAHP